MPALTQLHSLPLTLAPGPIAGCPSPFGRGCTSHPYKCCPRRHSARRPTPGAGHSRERWDPGRGGRPGRPPSSAPRGGFPGRPTHRLPALPPPCLAASSGSRPPPARLAPPPRPAGSRPARPLPTPSPAGRAALGMLRSPGRLGLRGDSSGSEAGRRERRGRLRSWGRREQPAARRGGAQSWGTPSPAGGRSRRALPHGSAEAHPAETPAWG